LKDRLFIDVNSENYSFFILKSGEAKDGFLPEPLYSFDEKGYWTFTFGGDYIEIRDLVAKSVSESKAVNYVSRMLDEFIDREYEPSMYSSELAQKVIEMFHKDISIDAGKGQYSINFESFEYFEVKDFSGRVVKVRKPLGQSIQTLAEFIGEKDGYKGRYVGDCDDFSMALLSCYEISRSLAEERRDNSKFWDKLFEGLERYQIFVIEVERNKRYHSLNMSVSFNKDFTEAMLRPIEPQCFYDDVGVCYKVDLRKLVRNKDKLVLLELRNVLFSKEMRRHKIYRIFNSKISYEYVGLWNED